jgi:hypothetical protein
MTRPEIGLQFLIMARMVYGVFGMNWKLSRGLIHREAGGNDFQFLN